MNPAPTLHCWEDYEWTLEIGSPEWVEAKIRGVGATCLLERGHEGPHQWTSDDQIVVRFVEAEDESTTKSH